MLHLENRAAPGDLLRQSSCSLQFTMCSSQCPQTVHLFKQLTKSATTRLTLALNTCAPAPDLLLHREASCCCGRPPGPPLPSAAAVTPPGSQWWSSHRRTAGRCMPTGPPSAPACSHPLIHQCLTPFLSSGRVGGRRSFSCRGTDERGEFGQARLATGQHNCPKSDCF